MQNVRGVFRTRRTWSRRFGRRFESGDNLIFLDRSRLIKELTERNLPINGTRGALADRLYDFVVNGTVPPEQSTPTTSTKKEKEKEEVVEPPTEEIVEEKPEEPVPIKTPTPKKGRKPRKSQAEKVTETVVSVKVEEEVVETRKTSRPTGGSRKKVTTVVKNRAGDGDVIRFDDVRSFDPAEPSPKKRRPRRRKKSKRRRLNKLNGSNNPTTV
ncbi:unnamed protein product [Caenorhabditis auriculariae]|uniref:SAP domain-containing protein n=1 Tax=Caenorhabditis auriculariae TaxID=2777116 RepID=A0A8S1HMZ3_9PELO|nr:unnamed protein product [Caenorhabditis auriculariae]